MPAIACLPIVPKPSSPNSTLINTHIDVHVVYQEKDRRGDGRVELNLYPTQHDADGFVKHSIAYGMLQFQSILVQPMSKNYKAKVAAVRDKVCEQFDKKAGEFYERVIAAIAHHGYTLLSVEEDREARRKAADDNAAKLFVGNLAMGNFK